MNRMKAGTRTISITSGKGGVGKTSLVTNLANCLSRQGQRVLIFDGDLGMANVDIMFGIRPKVLIGDVLKGEKPLSEAIVEVAPGISLIPGGSGIYELQSLSVEHKQTLLHQFSLLDSQFDIMLIDTAPGIDDNVLYFNAAAQETYILVTPDPSSIIDAYALIKVLNQRYKETKFSLICNQVRDSQEGLILYKKLSDLTTRFLCVSLDYKGHIPSDPYLRKATKAQQLVTNSYPVSSSGFAIKEIARNISGFEQMQGQKGGIQFFWQQMVGVA